MTWSEAINLAEARGPWIEGLRRSMCRNALEGLSTYKSLDTRVTFSAERYM